MDVSDISNPEVRKIIKLAKDLDIKPPLGKTHFRIGPGKGGQGYKLIIEIETSSSSIEVDPLFNTIRSMGLTELSLFAEGSHGGPDHYFISFKIPKAPKRRRRIFRPGQPPETV